MENVRCPGNGEVLIFKRNLICKYFEEDVFTRIKILESVNFHGKEYWTLLF